MAFKRNSGLPIPHRMYYKTLRMKGNKTKAVGLQKRLHHLLEEKSTFAKRIHKMSLHQSRSLLAECIEFIRRQNRQLQKYYRKDVRNERRFRKLMRKLLGHRSHSLFLKKSFNGLKSSIYDGGHIPNQSNEENLHYKLQLIRMLTKGNFKEAEECIKVARKIMGYHLGQVRRKNRSKRRVPKSPFEKAIWEFFNSLEINKRERKKDKSEIKKMPRPKGPYKVPKKRELVTKIPKVAGDEFKLNINLKELNYTRKSISLSNESIKDSINNSIEDKDAYKVYHTRSADDFPESKVKIKVYPREKTERNKTVDSGENWNRRETPYIFPTELENSKKNGINNKSEPNEVNKKNNLRGKKGINSTNKSKTSPTTEQESLKNDQTEQHVEESNTENESTKITPKTNKSHFRSFTYEKLKTAYRSHSLDSKRHITPTKKKEKSDESLAKSNNLISSNYFEATSMFNPPISESLIFNKSTLPFLTRKVSTLFGIPSSKSLDGVRRYSAKPQLPMSSVATEIIKRLYEQRKLTLDEPKRLHKKIDLTRLHSNSFLGNISKYRPWDQMDAVLGDLLGKYKEWSDNAKTPEEAHKCKKILKWRYIHNVQKLLHNHVKQLKMEMDGGRSEIGSRKSQISLRSIRSSYQVPYNYGSFAVLKESSETEISPIRPLHENFVRTQMDYLRSRIFDKDVERMERMIMGRHVPINEEDLEIFKKYKFDPQHFNILILSIGRSMSDDRYEEKLPVLERNFQFISHQLQVLSRERRIQKMLVKKDLKKTEEEEASKTSGDSCHYDRTVFNEAFLEKRREVWASYIAKQAKTPTEIVLEAVRKQKRKAQMAQKREEREQRNKQEPKILRKRRSPSALYRAPRRTHREQQVIEDMQQELESTKSKCSATSLCCRCCSRCGLIWTLRCSEGSTGETAEHICLV
ncbi:trichohyalin [Drosophila suzukii]|uniref:Trichohyalin n=1 Tax=Drosophila suzukii TaxID=28584 RepID=A0AB39Z5X6_DROSZ